MTKTETTSGQMTKYRWVICALLFLATTINYVDRSILSLLKPILDDQLHWTESQFAEINAAFQGAYGVSLFVFGWLIDRYGTKKGYATSIALWSVAAVSHALVHTVGGFFAARVALGLGEGGNFPAAVKATAQWFPKKERALATTLFNSGANVGSILAPAVVPVIASSLGWQWAFVFAGVAGFTWLILWIPLFDYPEKSRRVSTGELFYIESDSKDASTGRPATWGDVLGHRQAWAFIAAKFFTDPVWWFFLIWLPDFFKKTRGLDIKHSWTLLVSIYSIITILSIFGGWLSGHLIKTGSSVTAARKISMAIFAVAVIPIAVVTHVSDWTAVLLIGVAGAAHQAWSATIFTSVSDMFPKRMVAKLVGAGSTAGSFSGMGFPLLTGYVLDHYANGYAFIFAICASAYVVAFIVNNLLAPSFAAIAPAELDGATA